jgi:hypothetical protein
MLGSLNSSGNETPMADPPTPPVEDVLITPFETPEQMYLRELRRIIPIPNTWTGKPEFIPRAVAFRSSKLWDVKAETQARLALCAQSHRHHILAGDRGDHVRVLREAVFDLYVAGRYDPTNARRVGLRAFTYHVDGEFDLYTTNFALSVQSMKEANRILGPGQTVADAIIGIRTIAFIDNTLARLEAPMI